MIYPGKEKVQSPQAEVVQRHLRNKQGGQCCSLELHRFQAQV